MLEKLETQNKTVGIKQSMKALNQDRVAVLFIARDAEDYLVQNMKQIAAGKDVQVVDAASMKELGKACGIDVGAAVAAVLK